MKELSLYILDITMNSVKAGAKTSVFRSANTTVYSRFRLRMTDAA